MSKKIIRTAAMDRLAESHRSRAEELRAARAILNARKAKVAPAPYTIGHSLNPNI